MGLEISNFAHFRSLFNYFIGIKIDASITPGHRKSWLITGLIINLGILGFFKYFNFFIEGFVDLVSLFGYDLKGTAINVILPLGISFYTFLSLSYLLDINKKTLTADKNIIHVLLSLSFFPIILAGPIQRPSTLLPQIRTPRLFNYDQAVDGLRQILWGLFVKIAVADNMAPLANDIFLDYVNSPGNTLLMGALYYTIQIYADFSGYSHIAIGTASLLGFRLMKNFDYPYFAQRHNRILEKMAYITYILVPGLSFPARLVRSGMENKERKGTFYQDGPVHIYYCQPGDMVPDRSVAWGKLYFYFMGIVARIIINYLSGAEKTQKAYIKTIKDQQQ